jgi:hypothetical protein
MAQAAGRCAAVHEMVMVPSSGCDHTTRFQARLPGAVSRTQLALAAAAVLEAG